MDMTLIIGITGAGILLVMFVLHQLHIVSEDALGYDLLNAIGSALLVVYAVRINSIPFAILNAVWCLVSVRDVIWRKKGKLFRKKKLF